MVLAAATVAVVQLRGGEIGGVTGAGATSTAATGGPAAPAISALDIPAGGDTARVTWTDTAPPGTRHVLYTWFTGGKREVAAPGSPVSVAIPRGLPVCFQIVAVDDVAFTRSEPRCANDGDAANLVGGPASPPGTA
jgi:hypothetical protein